MSEYIEREAAKLRIFEYGVKHRDNANIASACENLERQISAIPAADVRPVVKAVWEPNVPPRDLRPRCSVCGELQSRKTNFCPNCGADMRGEQHV